MKILDKIMDFFKRTRESSKNIKNKINAFISEHREQIKIIMNVLEIMFPPQTGAQKMACVVKNICSAIGCSESDKVSEYVENKCQEVYQEFKSNL